MKHYYENIEGWFTFSELYCKMVNKFPDGSHFVEVGSWKGKSAVYMGVEIINSNKKIRFDCIDSWEFLDDIYTKLSYLNKSKLTAFEEFLKNVEPLYNVINYHKINSIEGSKLFEDESLDFVYIDASHEYENVKNDLIYWYPKVKYGGVFAGHDYGSNWKGVKLAVDEFFKNIKFETPEASWVYYKNKI
jgi:hypothetical protein